AAPTCVDGRRSSPEPERRSNDGRGRGACRPVDFTARGGWPGPCRTWSPTPWWPSDTSWKPWATALPTWPPEPLFPPPSRGRGSSGSGRPVGDVLASHLVHLLGRDQDDGVDLRDPGRGDGRGGRGYGHVVGGVEDHVEVVITEGVVEGLHLRAHALRQ